MKVNSPEAIAAAWDRLCDTYADDLADLAKRKALAAVELAVIRKELNGRDGLCILDAGCGTGQLSIPLITSGHSVVGVDVSEVMLNIARGKLTPGTNARFEVGDVRWLKYPDNTFDAMVAS